MDWILQFYSTTREWWGEAEPGITERDLRRVRLVRQYRGADSLRVLDLGSRYGSTAAAIARAGHHVTGIESADRADFSSRFSAGTSSFTFGKDDFYLAEFPDRFDVVCYWNGFGAG